ncbi:MAG: hypothetical protein ABIH48_03275 [Candidatus Falkowbacteria bacterium]
MSIKKLRFLEFIVIGLFMGMIEDILAVVLTTDSSLSFNMLGIIFLIALPFAFVSEYVVDHPRFWQIFFKEHEN